MQTIFKIDESKKLKEPRNFQLNHYRYRQLRHLNRLPFHNELITYRSSNYCVFSFAIFKCELIIHFYKFYLPINK